MTKAKNLHRILTLLLASEENIIISSDSDSILIGCNMPLNNSDIAKELGILG